MRGYGAWCMGWNEGGRKRFTPPSNNGGCGVFLLGFGILFLISCLKVSFETGNPMGLFLGIAVIAGIFKGLANQ